jgi:hypothetical protein
MASNKMSKIHDQETLLQRIKTIEREMEQLKRDLLRSWNKTSYKNKTKQTLFGSVRGDDITPEMITDARKSLFRHLDDV